MLKRQHLQAWATTAHQIYTTATPAVLRGASSSPLPLRAFAISGIASYSTEPPGGSARSYNPWKEWIRPNKRAQARYELYGDRWQETQKGKEKGMEDALQVQRERSRGHLRRRLGENYDAVVAETKKEAYERYKSEEWRGYIEEIKKELLARDKGRRERGLLHIELPESSQKPGQD